MDIPYGWTLLCPGEAPILIGLVKIPEESFGYVANFGQEAVVLIRSSRLSEPEFELLKALLVCFGYARADYMATVESYKYEDSA
jgi:hypothetical protein